jgi:hypothetical protein
MKSRLTIAERMMDDYRLVGWLGLVWVM